MVSEVSKLPNFERQVSRLSPMTLHPSLEGEAAALFEASCCGSRKLWPLDRDELQTQESRAEFYRLANAGMWEAQERFIDCIQRVGPWAPGEQALYRMAMDSIAWQMIGKQLCYARRLYRDQKQPDLYNSNFRSLVAAARHFRVRHPSSMPLIADLTTFLQIGDLLVADPESGFSIVEVKEGAINHKVFELASFYRESGCEQFRAIVSQTEAAATVKQFERLLRQMDRMDFAKKVLGEGRARDPDSDQVIDIPEPFIPIDEWDEELNKVMNACSEKGWAIDVIDDCLFVGAYSKHMIRAAPFAYVGWLTKFSEGEFMPVARLIDSVYEPLTLPTFMLPASPERMLDLLFGRLHVCMGISIPGLVEACEMSGIDVRHARGKAERARVHAARGQTINYKGKPIFLEKDGKTMLPAAGMFTRCLFHFQRPISLIHALFDNLAEQEHARKADYSTLTLVSEQKVHSDQGFALRPLFSSPGPPGSGTAPRSAAAPRPLVGQGLIPSVAFLPPH